MSVDKIEIKLTSVGAENVDIEQMSSQSLNSFLNVINSLKNISEQTSKVCTFSIKKGSAYAAVNGEISEISKIYTSIDEAINGNSTDDVVTSNLRIIQKEIQREAFNYQFLYGEMTIDDRLKSAKKITKKRSKQTFANKIAVISGFFNQIGGNDPNYHFDYGNGNRLTIECTKLETEELKNYLYKNISCLVIKKETEDDESKAIYEHKTVVEEMLVYPFQEFLRNYYEKIELVHRLEYIYEFIDNSENKLQNIELLLYAFKSKVFELSELKTILVISKPFQNNHEQIRLLRNQLLGLYDEMINQIK